MECALYWDLSQNAFAESKNQDETDRIAPIVANCNGIDVNNGATGNSNSATTDFEFKVNDPNDSNGPCANVKVEKEKITENGIDKIKTTIKSQGKNICGASGRRVERGLRASITKDM